MDCSISVMLLQRRGLSNSNHTLQDYEMELLILETQKKKRLMMAIGDNSNENWQVYQMQIMLLEQQKKKRLMMAKDDDSNEKRQDYEM